jgi:hypothetical protein
VRCPTCNGMAEVRLHEVNSHGAARTTVESYRCPQQCILDESIILEIVTATEV